MMCLCYYVSTLVEVKKIRCICFHCAEWLWPDSRDLRKITIMVNLKKEEEEEFNIKKSENSVSRILQWIAFFVHEPFADPFCKRLVSH